jgi:L-histidine N-alpha-methyltransferase
MHAAEIATRTGATSLVELGSGTSEKTRILLDALVAGGTLARYVPLDVSEETLRAAATALHAEYPDLVVHGVVGDFHRHLGQLPADGRRLIAFLGSTIGNLTPAERRRFFFDLDCVLGRDEWFLLGVDLEKARGRLLSAYDDAAGVTAAFNRNALHVLNDRLGADFDPSKFEHVAVWNDAEHRVEMHLRSTMAQRVFVKGLDLEVMFAAGESLRTEISTKFTAERLASELWDAGFVVEQTWTDDDFLLVLSRPFC